MANQTEFVGDYRLYHLIRAGATFEIWAVRPKSENTPYAMKWLPKGAKYNRTTVAELKHEYEVGKGLEHPGVIKTYEYANTKEGAYLLMEFFKTPNIKQQLTAVGHRALLPRLKDILVNAAAGVTHMHEKGWVHRDLKPDNFLLNDENAVRLIDFTIGAKPTSGLGKLFGGKVKVQGTYSYMAPEQITGDGVDPRDDIYSFGVMIYEMLTGKLPFTANSPNELLQRHLKSKPSNPTVIDKNIRPEFASFVVDELLAKERKQRPANMKDVVMRIKGERMFLQPPQPPEQTTDEGDDE